MEQYFINDIFKVPIYRTKLSLDVEQLEKFCIRHMQFDNGVVQTNAGGYHSKNLDKSDKTLEPLINKIEEHSNEFIQAINENNKQVLDNVWFNVNYFGNANYSHSHPKASVSGCYYVKTPSNSGNIRFEHPAKEVLGWYNSNTPVNKWNYYNAPECDFEPKENDLFLFPSWVMHNVFPNMNRDKERISIAFNTICTK